VQNVTSDGTLYTPSGLTSNINGQLVLSPTGSLDGNTNPTYNLNGNVDFGNGGGGTITLHANLVVRAATTYAHAAALNDAGFTITVDNGGTLQSAGSAAITADSITVNSGGTFNDANASAINANVTVGGGTFYSNGTVTGNVVMSSGTLGVGASGNGLLTISGNYTQSGGTLSLNATGAHTSTTDFGNLHVGGTAAISGAPTIQYTLSGGYSGAAGDFFVPIDATTATGHFATSTVVNAAAGLEATNTIFAHVFEFILNNPVG
jgi:hypothetical protein